MERLKGIIEVIREARNEIVGGLIVIIITGIVGLLYSAVADLYATARIFLFSVVGLLIGLLIIVVVPRFLPKNNHKRILQIIGIFIILVTFLGFAWIEKEDAEALVATSVAKTVESQEISQLTDPLTPQFTPETIREEVTRVVEVTRLVESIKEIVVTEIVEVTVPPLVVTRIITNTVVPSSVTPTIPPEETTNESLESPLLLREDFSNGIPNWDFPASARISQERLAVTVNAPEWVWLSIPEVQVDGDFYIQAQITYIDGHDCFSHMGFALGSPTGGHHRFVVLGRCGGDEVAFYNNDSPIFSTGYGSLFEKGTTLLLKLEYSEGLYTLYINGTPTESSTQIEPYGNYIGVIVWRSSNDFFPKESEFFVDNVEVGLLP